VRMDTGNFLDRWATLFSIRRLAEESDDDLRKRLIDMRLVAKGQSYFVISVHHTQRTDKYILLWNPNDAGYCYRTEVAGRYSKEQILKSPHYYNSGERNVAVPVKVLENISEMCKKGYLDTDGLVVKNNARNWEVIRKNLIAKPQYYLEPEYRGAPRKSHEKH